MSEKNRLFYFNSAEADSLYAMRFLQAEKENGTLPGAQWDLLSCMEEREREGCVFLIPAVIYAAANHAECKRLLENAPEGQKKRWYARGVEWMRQTPSFLEKFGWKERRFSLMAAGILAEEEKSDSDGAPYVRWLVKNGWRFLWERIGREPFLDACVWEDLRGPWKDSEYMGSAMSGVILLMAALHQKPVRDRDQLWHDIRQLQTFTAECQKSGPACFCGGADRLSREDERLVWLSAHFKNPQRPTYIREKGRLCSDWLQQLYQIMALAGLPASACETMTLSGREVEMLLCATHEKMTERQYMTFLLLYALARELAQAGRRASMLDRPESV